MSSLGRLPEVFGFFSYSREDDKGSDGRLSKLREAIHRELRAELGRSDKNFGLFQDKEAIPFGALWEKEIAEAVEKAVFFIPIVTPRTFLSPQCKIEFDAFLARERALARDDLVFPILYRDVPELEDDVKLPGDSVLSIIRKRQYADWREIRLLPADDARVSQSIDRFCRTIAKALREPWLTPEERRQREEIAARQRAEDERKQQDAEAKKRAEEKARRKREEEKRRRAEEAAAAARKAEEDRKAAQAIVARAAEEKRRKREQVEAEDGTGRRSPSEMVRNEPQKRRAAESRSIKRD
jgi:flagellar biosynthesis GTPase FlhF